MAMGKQEKEPQGQIWIETADLSKGPGHPFYRRLNEILDKTGFDGFAEGLCRRFYADRQGRPSLPPPVYLRLLLIGYFEGIDSERGIAWRVADSLALRDFLGYGLTTSLPDHSTISRTRRLIDIQTHQEVFTWVLGVLAKEQLLRGKTLGIDATTLEASAALRSIVRRDSGESYQEFLTSLAKASGIETPTREDLARIDRKRAKKGSNEDWQSPTDTDAKITKMKDGRTHLGHKVEHAVDMETGAVVAVTLHGANLGDTASIEKTLEEAKAVLSDVVEDEEAQEEVRELSEVVADKGYHSNAVLVDIEATGIRTYISEPQRGRRNWSGQPAAKTAVYANRRYETGAMRRTHLRQHSNILKRLLIHVAGFNLGLVMRKQLGIGKPRVLQGLGGRFLRFICGSWESLTAAATWLTAQGDHSMTRLITSGLQSESGYVALSWSWKHPQSTFATGS